MFAKSTSIGRISVVGPRRRVFELPKKRKTLDYTLSAVVAAIVALYAAMLVAFYLAGIGA